MAESDRRYNIVDEKTPVNELLTAHYRRSFAYYTIRDRLPVILTQVIDQIARDKEVIIIEYGEEFREGLKDILGSLSQLKYELQTDKEFQPIDNSSVDAELWNTHLVEMKDKNTYYSAIWLHAECYLYRRIKAIFEIQNLKDFDYFLKQKENALTSQFGAMKLVAKRLDELLADDSVETREIFLKLMKLNLWGNRCDLSISAGKESKTGGDPFASIAEYEEFILADDSNEIWNCLVAGDNNDAKTVDIIHDNSGYELFTDLCIADFIVQKNLAKNVRFHVKQIPWFVSDVNPHDFHWTLKTLRSHPDQYLSNLGQRCSDNLFSGRFKLVEPNYFWTSGYPFNRMEDIDPTLYNSLKESHFIFFKGDLNYRKLMGEINWESTSGFESALKNFRPSSLCALRTIKADLVSGLMPGVAQQLDEKDSRWMETGQYGLIQFAKKL